MAPETELNANVIQGLEQDETRRSETKEYSKNRESKVKIKILTGSHDIVFLFVDHSRIPVRVRPFSSDQEAG